MGSEQSKHRHRRRSRSNSRSRSQSRAAFISPSELPPFPPPSGYWILPAGPESILGIPKAPPVPTALRNIPTTSTNRYDKGKSPIPVTSPASSFSSISSISTEPTSTSNSPGGKPDHGVIDLAISLLTELSMLRLDGPYESRPKATERGRIRFTEVTDGPADTYPESTDHIRWEEWKLESEREMMERERRLLLRELELGLESYPKKKKPWFGVDGADDMNEHEPTMEDEEWIAATEDEECVSPAGRRVWYSKVVERSGWTGEVRRWEYGSSRRLHTKDFAVDDEALLDGPGSSRVGETGERNALCGLRRSRLVGDATLDVAETLTAEERDTVTSRESPSRARSTERLATRSRVGFLDAVERQDEGRVSPRRRSSRCLRSSARAQRVQSAEMLKPPMRSSSLGRTSGFSMRSSSVPTLEHTEDERPRQDVLEPIPCVLERSDTHHFPLVDALGRTPTMRKSPLANLTPATNRSVRRPLLVVITNPQTDQSGRASFSNTSSSIELPTPDALSFEPTTPSSAPTTLGTPNEGDDEYEVLMAQLRGTLRELTGLFVRNGMGIVVTMVHGVFGGVGRSVRRLGLELHQLFGCSDPLPDGRAEQ